MEWRVEGLYAIIFNLLSLKARSVGAKKFVLRAVRQERRGTTLPNAPTCICTS